MRGLKGLYDQGELAVLNSVGYPNPDRSHFRSLDIWQTGSAADQHLSTGWLGRYLDSNCAGGDHPYTGLELDDTLSLALKGETRKGLALKNPAKLRQLISNRYVAAVSRADHSHETHAEVDYLYRTLAETTSSAQYLYEKSKIYKSSGAYPDTAFGKSLRTTSELINSGIESRVFYVALAGFDTHVRQQAQQQRLLSELADGLAALADDLRQGGEWANTRVLVFSEFGRRVGQNASHGTANNVLLLGGSLRRAGVLNAAPNLADLDQGDLKFELDFRSIYASALHDWLGADDASILGTDFARLPLMG